MRWTQRYGIVAIAIIVVLALIFVLQQKQHYEEQTRQTIETLQNRIDYVSRLNDEHLQELSSIKQQNIRLIRSFNSIKACHRRNNVSTNSISNSTITDETFNDNTVDSLKNGFHLPPSFSYLKHLSGRYDMLSPAFRRQTTNTNSLRSNVSFIIGIPTVKRDKQSYLIETIKSLIDNLNNDDMERSLIVIFIAEPLDIEYVRTTAQQIEKLYNKYIENGLIEIISPPMEFYPDFDSLKLSLNDDKQRVKWRTKQNYDFTYLMMYSSIRGKYYIQLEDDVVTKPAYIQIIESFINKQKDQDWFMLEYSSLGFIGKMFHTAELNALVNFFLMFSADKPIDWLLEYYQDTKYCSFGADVQSCTRTKSLHRFRFRPSLFQHIGIYSSLKGKIQKLKDKDFGKNVKLFKSHENPSVSSIVSTLKDYDKHTLANCYAGQNFFWALQPKKDDTIVLKYDPPLLLSRVYFKSGNPEHPGDKFFNTTVDLQPYVQPKQKLNYIKDSDGYFTVANFSHDTGIAEAFVDKVLGPISNVRLKVHSKSDAWVILNEILIEPLK
ncbi:unnamed protein product [Adineta steineri]|uniref:Uncharacterized protein n=1 Tax=Adineta steineri TaxID=433720 RepID=A0A818ZFC4_9BILA|nr:unnamed protein product [Adineta steineri]